MLSNFSASMAINQRALADSYEKIKELPEDQATDMLQSFLDLSEAAPHLFALGLVERIVAMVLHIALSVLVWKAVKEGKKLYLAIAVLLHFAVDASAVLVTGITDNVYAIEGFICAATAIAVGIVVLLTQKKKETVTI